MFFTFIQISCNTKKAKVMLSIKVKKMACIVFVSSFIIFPISCANTSNQKTQIKKDMLKIKLGMNYQEVKSILGYPHIILFSTRKDFEKFKEIGPKEELFDTFETHLDPITKSGEIDWMYIQWDKNYTLPVYSFDSNTGKLIRHSRRTFEGS
jgi:hypothetical protein